MPDAMFIILFWGGFVLLAALMAVAHSKFAGVTLLGGTLFFKTEKELILQQKFWPFFLRRIIGVLPFVLMVFLNHSEKRPLTWWHALMFFAFGWAVGAVWNVARHARPVLKLGKSGLEISGKKPGCTPILLAWQEIEEITTVKRFLADVQEVTIVPADKTKKSIRLLPSDYGCPPEYLFAALKAYHAAGKTGEMVDSAPMQEPAPAMAF